MRNKLIIIFCLLTALILANLHLNNNKKQHILVNEVFPTQIQSWKSKDLAIDKSTYEMLDKDELLSRQYSNIANGKRLYLAIVLTNKRDHIHDPEVCGRGQGLSMEKETKITLNKNFNIVYVNGSNVRNKVHMVYWYTDLDKTYNNRVNFLKNITKDLFFDRTSGNMALVIVQGEQKEVNKQDLFKFASLVSADLKKIKK